MAAVKNKLGRIPCDCCGHPAMLKENEAGTLTIACDECDVSSFAKKGTTAAASWRAKLPKEPAQDAPKPAPSVSVPKAPAQERAEEQPAPPRHKASAWDPLGVMGVKHG
jgi:uncharacterized Zn finger protein (UPF0148 family)